MKKERNELDVTDIFFNLFVQIFDGFMDEDPMHIVLFTFDLKRFGLKVFRYVYDYQVLREGKNVLRRTADALGYSKSGADKLLKRKK